VVPVKAAIDYYETLTQSKNQTEKLNQSAATNYGSSNNQSPTLFSKSFNESTIKVETLSQENL
jgi:hypothetical protein